MTCLISGETLKYDNYNGEYKENLRSQYLKNNSFPGCDY